MTKEADQFLKNVGVARTKGEAQEAAIIFHHLDGAETREDLVILTEMSESMVGYTLKKN